MRLICLNGIAATGKDTIIRELLKSKNVRRIINCTTRSPRNGEKEAVDYYFINEEQHMHYVSSNQYATYNTVHGRHYGTLRTEFSHTGNELLVGHFGQNDLNILINDDRIMSEYEIRVIFLVVPFSVWKQRMCDRLKTGFISQDEMKSRAESALVELSFIAKFYSMYRSFARILSNTNLARSIDFIIDDQNKSDEKILFELIEEFSENYPSNLCQY